MSTELKTLNGYGFDATKLGGLDAQYYAKGRAAHNLLDNSDFANPVNSRGKTSYSGGKYTIDRWGNQTGTNMTIMDGFIRITGDWDTRQYLREKLIGTYTFAVCAKVNVAGEYIQTIEVFENDSPLASSMCTGVGEWKIYTCTATFTGANNITNQMVIINNRAGSISDASMDVKWAALYEGSYDANTILAYQPKGYATELAECQRYYRQMSYPVIPCGNNPAGTQVYGYLPFRMRIANPTVSCDKLYFFKGDSTFCPVLSASAASYGAGTRIVFDLSQSVEGNLAGAVAGNGITISADL